MSKQAVNYIISTDLDGTLLDHNNYSYSAALSALNLCHKNQVPVIFNTSKTKNESLDLQKNLNIEHPFIIENGSAVIVPDSYFTSSIDQCLVSDNNCIYTMGKTRTEILNYLAKINNNGRFNFEGFSNWNTEQIAEKTGLSLAAARQANQREFSEPVIWLDSQDKLAEFKQLLYLADLTVLRGGRFLHILGKSDKGSSIKWLKKQYEVNFNKQYQLVCLGDSQNDIAMLEAADIAIVVKSPVHKPPELNSKNTIYYTEQAGPDGWNDAITKLFNGYFQEL